MDIRLGEAIGNTLTDEEKTLLSASITHRKISENLSGQTKFWGKIFANEQDYLIVVNSSLYRDTIVKTFYFCTSNDYNLRLLPTISNEFALEAEKLLTNLTGDPSYFKKVVNSNGDEESDEKEEEEGAEGADRKDAEAAEPEDAVPEDAIGSNAEEASSEDAVPETDDEQKGKKRNKSKGNKTKEVFREVHRLAYIVQKIDHDCSVIPRGLLTVDVKKNLTMKKYFEGIKYEDAKSLREFMHFRNPESKEASTLLKKPGLILSSDILDSLERDAPQNIWTVEVEEGAQYAILRHVYWQGYGFYASLANGDDDGPPTFGGAYFGAGLPNHDLAFVL